MRLPLTTQTSISPFFLGAFLSIPLLGTACRPTPDANAADQAPPAIPVQLETLRAGILQESSGFVGKLEAVQIAEIRPKATGRIEKILVKSGQTVKAGQELIVLQPDQTLPESQSASVGVDVAKGDRENAIKKVDIAKAKRDSIETKLGSAQSKRDTAKAKLQSAQSQRDTAKANLKVTSEYVVRLRKLVKDGVIERLRLDELLQKETAAKSELITAENEIVTAKSNIVTAESDIVTAQNDIITAEQEVAAAEVAAMQQNSAILQATAKAKASLVGLQDRKITAPIAGVMDNLPVKVGTFVSTGQDVVATVTQVDNLFLNLQIPANRSDQLSNGLRVNLVDPKSKKKLASGNLTFVSPTVSGEGQTILAKALFPNVSGQLRHNQNVQARIIWNNQPGLLIPSTAIFRVGGKNFVYVAEDKDGTQVAKLKPIELGEIQGDRYQVKSGLRAGDRLAISNILKLRDGASLKPETKKSSINIETQS